MRTPVTVAAVVDSSAGVALARTIDEFPRARLTWICDRRPNEPLPRWTPREARRTARLQDVLEDETVDAVVAAPGIAERFELARSCLGADKHVLIEGVVAERAQDAERLVRRAVLHDRRLVAGHVSLSHPGTEHLRRLVGLGRLGELFYIRATRNASPASGADAVLWGAAAEEVARVLEIVSDEPVEVSARGDSYLGGGFSDVVSCYLRFATGITAQIDVSALDPRPVRRVVAVGSARTAVLDELTPVPLAVYDAGDDVGEDSDERVPGRVGDVFAPRVGQAHPRRTLCERFVLDVASSADAPARDVVTVVAVLEALERSLLAGAGASSDVRSTRPDLQVVAATAETS